MTGSSKRIAVITDSTCDIPANLVEQHNIIVVPLYVVWGEEEFRDGVDIDNTAFYTRLLGDPIHPKTSQPTPADFVHVIEESGAQEVVIVTIADNLSGTYASAIAAREMVGIPVHVVDSLSLSMGLGWQALAAARARDRGADADAIVAETHRVRDSLHILLTVDTLEFLHKGGRIGGAARLVGSAIRLKPLLTIDHSVGRLEPVESIRTRPKALHRLLEVTFERVDPERPMHVAVIHAAALDDTNYLLEEIKTRHNPLEITISEITPVLGVHGGPGLVGICAYND
jgi:DegV family protein with EDD domain